MSGYDFWGYDSLATTFNNTNSVTSSGGHLRKRDALLRTNTEEKLSLVAIQYALKDDETFQKALLNDLGADGFLPITSRTNSGRRDYSSPQYEKDPFIERSTASTLAPQCIFNNAFQELIDSMSDTNILKEENVFIRLSSLARDFRYTALQYGKIIISEKHVPNDERTIPACTDVIGGLAGGEKFIKGGILFKFAIDFQGVYGSDEYAAKEAGHQLKGAIGLFNTQKADEDQSNAGLRFPLVMLIDYLGHRLVAMSLLPIDKATLLYGSSDAGRTVKTSPMVRKTMEDAAQLLKLKLHKVGSRPDNLVELHMPCDIEVHQGSDGRLYCLDFARLFPPEPPTGELRSAHLIRLLRPEFVRRNAVPLSSDVFSAFSKYDPDKAKHEQEVREAHKRLLSETIPDFAKLLAEEEEVDQALDHDVLISKMHAYGINARYLGHIRAALPSASQKRREHILVECAARCIKRELRFAMREKMMELGRTAWEPYRIIALELLNSYFANTPESERRRATLLAEEVQKKFPHCLSEEELEHLATVKANSSKNLDLLLPSTALVTLFERARQLCGIEISDDCVENVVRDQTEFFLRAVPFEDTDIVGIREIVKQIPLLEYAQGTALFIRSLSKTGEERLKLARKAEKNFIAALSVNSSDYMTLCNYGFLCHSIFEDASKAEELYQKAIEINSHHVRSLYYYAIFYQRNREDFVKARYYFERALEVCPTHANALKDYAHLLRFQFNEVDEAERLYMRAIEAAPNHTKALLGYANVQQHVRNDKPKAGRYYKLAFESDPTNIHAIHSHLRFAMSSGIVVEKEDCSPVSEEDEWEVEVKSASSTSSVSLQLIKYNRSSVLLLTDHVIPVAKRAAEFLVSYATQNDPESFVLREGKNVEVTCSRLAELVASVAWDAGRNGLQEIAQELFASIVCQTNLDVRKALRVYIKFLVARKDTEQARVMWSRLLVMENENSTIHKEYLEFLNLHARDAAACREYAKELVSKYPEDPFIKQLVKKFINTSTQKIQSNNKKREGKQ